MSGSLLLQSATVVLSIVFGHHACTGWKGTMLTEAGDRCRRVRQPKNFSGSRFMINHDGTTGFESNLSRATQPPQPMTRHPPASGDATLPAPNMRTWVGQLMRPFCWQHSTQEFSLAEAEIKNRDSSKVSIYASEVWFPEYRHHV